MPKPIKGLTAAARGAGMKGGGYVPTGSIRWRMGHVHVGASRFTVAREFWNRAAKWPRPLKRAIVRTAIREHLKNRDLYNFVMRGGR